ncbi:MAG: fumarylacetoacetate hydrolase family protein [Hyphomicrobiales bacterium]
MDVAAIGKLLAETRLEAARLEEYPGPAPANLIEAYAIQDAMIEAMRLPIAGWKIGCTSQAARTALGIDEPISGPVFETFVSPGPAAVPVGENDLRIVEAEIGFRLKQDLGPRDTPYTKADILDAIATVHPMFEVANKRLPGPQKEAAVWIVADGAINQAIVFGNGIPFDADMDLANETVKVSIDGVHATDGIGSNALGGPLEVMVWIANHLSERGIGLKANDWVSTGLICDLLQPNQGATIVAEFGTIGTLSLKLSAQ